MQNAIRVGNYAISTRHISSIRFDAGEHDSPHIMTMDHEDQFEFSPGSPEGRALRWYFLEADRAVLEGDGGMTVDVVREHRLAQADGTAAPDAWEARPAVVADEAYAATVRNHHGYPALAGTNGGAA